MGKRRANMLKRKGRIRLFRGGIEFQKPIRGTGHMSKYDALWAYIQGRNEETLVLSFADIAQIAGTPLEQRPDQRGICRFYLGA